MTCNCLNENKRSCIEIVPIFSNLNRKEKHEIANITTQKTFEKGEMIYLAGEKSEKLYVVNSGKVKITRITEYGKEQVIRVLGPGDFMGELSIFSSLPLTDNSEALSKTITCTIDGKKLKDLMIKYPPIAFKIMEELSQRLENTEKLIENINLHGVEKRLALFLMDGVDHSGQINLKMSKKDLASYLGMTQETLSRKLTSFQDRGIIKLIGHRRIVVLNRKELEIIE